MKQDLKIQMILLKIFLLKIFKNFFTIKLIFKNFLEILSMQFGIKASATKL